MKNGTESAERDRARAPYVFFGTPKFAARILEALIFGGFEPLSVVANPDRPAGRKKIMTPPATKTLVRARDDAGRIGIFQPEKLDVEAERILRNLAPDFFIVAAYSKILPRRILEIPKLGSLGVHPSFLPRHRGPAPIQTAILSGDEETGVTIYLMDEGVDRGPIIAQRSCPIEKNETYETLEKKLAASAGALLLRTLPSFLEGALTPQPQDESQATFTKKFSAADGFVDAADVRAAKCGDQEKAAVIGRKIRALNPEPGVWTIENGVRIKLLAARNVGTAFSISKIQIAGRKPTKETELLLGS